MRKLKKTLVLMTLLPIITGCGQTGAGSSVSEGSSHPSSTMVTEEFAFDETNPSTMKVGEVYDFKTNMSGVTFKGDDPLVATVSESGTVTALRNGTIELRATKGEDEVIKCFVIIENVTGITVSLSSKVETLAVGESYKFTGVASGDSKNAGVGYLVNNNALASIDENGTLTAKQVGKEGKVIVTCYSKTNPNAIAEQEVKITAKDGKSDDGNVETKNGYSLIWEDDFLGDKLNKNNWEAMIGDGSEYSGRGWGNDEQEFYKEENAKVADGKLIITAKNADLSKSKNQPYTSARLRSRNKVAYTYGRIESKISLPRGRGLWPAFWMLPERAGEDAYGSWPNSGEIDIMEANGKNRYDVNGTIHYYDTVSKGHAWLNGTYTFPESNPTDITDDHVYAVEWDEGEIRWYIDDILYYTCNAEQNTWSVKSPSEFPSPFDQPFHILLNLAVGGNYVSNNLPSDREIPAQMKVDYVKWYQK